MVFARFAPLVGYGCLFIGAGGGYLAATKQTVWAKSTGPSEYGLLSGGVPTRPQQLARLRDSTREAPWDILIVGGGATGTGTALDAATR